MKRSASDIAVIASVLVLASLLIGCGGSGKREGAIGPDLVQTGTVQQGDPALAAAAGYTGSKTCSTCHPDHFTGWSKSLHNFPLKTVAELGDGIFVNDANGNGQDDFKDTLDFNNPATDSLIEANANGTALKNARPNAPILKFVGGKHVVSIAGVEFEIQRIQGGNGYWKQRYQTKVGKSYYISPVQYNEVSKKYEAYNASHWYSGTNTPRYTQAYGTDNLVAQFGALNVAPTRLGTARSWENRCAGCHQTGLTVTSQTQAYAGSDVTEVVSGYVELNIGCEACHGPGAAHAASRNPADIINPGNFANVGVTGIRVANMACGSCHSRGEGNATLTGMSLNTEYPARLDGGAAVFPLPGANFIDNSAGNPFVILNTSTAYYGAFPSAFKANGTRDIYSAYRNWYAGYNFPIYVASRQHHQAWTDMEQGPHAPDKDTDITCWDCHDPHKAAGNPNADPGDDHQIRTTITQAGVTLSTRDDDNTLCLACHADDFGLSVNDVRINSPSVRTAVLAHMGKEAVMGDEHIAERFDPAGTGIGRCSKCHMPKTASSAIRTAIGGTVQEGDIHNHSFQILWPSVNVLVDNTMANSCYSAGCHSNAPLIAGSQVIDEWSRSGHADFTGRPFRDWDADGEIPASCAKCHSPHGFNDFALDGVVGEPSELGHKISCGACHTEEGDGTTLWDKRATYTALDNVLFPSGVRASLANDSNMCMACHQGRAAGGPANVGGTVDNVIAAGGENNLTFVNNHYFAAAATLFGTQVRGGYEYADNVYVGRFAHVTERDTCIECHMGRSADLLENNHTFQPKTTYCLPCHANAFDPPSDPANPFRDIRFGTLGIDFDGDGNAVEGIYFEIWPTLVPALYAQIQNYANNVIGTPIVYAPGVYPYWFKDNNPQNGQPDAAETVFANRYNVFDAKLLRAAYNYTVVQNEPCGYIHNARYHIELLYDSTRDLGGDAAVAAFTRDVPLP